MADSCSSTSVSPTATTSTNITTASSSSINADPLACQWAQCGERCSSPETLYDHVCERHVGRKSTNNLNLQCQWGNCRTTTVKRDHITSHIRVHVPLKPHKCEFCGKSFKRPQDLKKHVKTHADESVLLRSPEPPVPAHKPNMASSYQPNTMRTSGYYQDTNSHVQAGSYGYPNGNANHNHFNAPLTTASYGPVYYNVPQTTGYATGAAVESRKRGFDDLNDFFGNAKRRQIDATQYQDLGSRFGGLMNAGLPLSGFQAGYNAGLMAASGGNLLDDHMATAYQPSHSVATMPQAHYNAPFAELKTKNDLLSLDQFLEQLQQTVYENPDHAAAAGVQPMGEMQHTGFSHVYRPSHSPPRVVHNPSLSSVSTGSDVFSNTPYNHAASIASSSAFDDNTPALTPSSYAAASQSPASSQVNMSPMTRPAAGNASLYPTLPSFSTLTDLGAQHAGGISGAPPMSGLGAAFDEFDTRRRYSGGFLQRAQPPRLSPLSHINTHGSVDSAASGSEATASPSSRRSSVDLSKGFRSVNLSSPKPNTVKLPGVASITRVDTRESAGSSPSEASTTTDDDKQEAWVKNMRVIEGLLKYVRGRLDRGEYDDNADKAGDERKEKEKSRDRDDDVEMKDLSGSPSTTGAQASAASSLYPVLRPMEATS